MNLRSTTETNRLTWDAHDFKVIRFNRNIPSEVIKSHKSFNIWHQIASLLYLSEKRNKIITVNLAYITYNVHCIVDATKNRDIPDIYSSPVIRHVCQRNWPVRHTPTLIDLREVKQLDISGHIFVAGWTDDMYNYYHLLMDICPRLSLINQQISKYENVQIVFIGPDSLLVRNVIKSLYPSLESKLIFARPDHYLLKEASFAIPTAPSYLDEEFIISINKLIRTSLHKERLLSYANRNHKIIYLKRGIGKNGRSISNEESLITHLKAKFGAHIIDGSSMTVIDQWLTIYSAEIVIAPHGAALTNILACRKGITVIELLDKNYSPSTFWFISHFLGNKHIRLIQDTPGRDGWPIQKLVASIASIVCGKDKLISC
jgi:hypothetical protein